MELAGLVRLRWLVGTLLIAAAALFAVGVATEGAGVHADHRAVESGEHLDEGEHAERAEQDVRSEGSEVTGEVILGINLESTTPVVLAVLISVTLAVATWRRDHKLTLLVTAAFATVFAVLDVAEFSHQITESAASVVAIAAVIAVLHVAAALLAEQRRNAVPHAVR